MADWKERFKMTGAEIRASVIEQIKQCVCKDRCNTHGEAEQNFADIAHVWSWWLKSRYNAHVRLDELDVAEMMNLMKSARKAKTPFHLDHWVDGGGYNVCGAGIVKKALDEQALKKELDGLAPAVDHGEEELKKTGRVLRCGAADSNRNQCVLLEGHVSDHAFESYYPHTK